MAKKSSEVQNLTNQLAQQERVIEAKDAALARARKALFNIQNTDPVSHTVRGEAGKSSGLGIVRAFKHVQEQAEKGIIEMSDAEADAYALD